MTKIIGKGEYGNVISQYFKSSFPKIATFKNGELLEVLTDVLIGTKEYRYGSKPNIESQYRIRETLRKAIELRAPIPILVPWGGRKVDPTISVDIAEVSAVRQLVMVDQLVKQFYPPGLHIHIRIEDTGAFWIYRVQDTDESIERYSSDMIKLVDFLKGDTSIEPIRESKLMNRQEYFRLSEEYSELIEETIQTLREFKGLDINSIPAFKKLKDAGWVGDINKEQQAYYVERYKKLYPNLKQGEYDLMLADYLGGSKARYDLKGVAEPDSSVGSYIKISFVPPIPGAPEGMFNNTLYYRTLPASHGRTHIAPWRGKGYLELVDEVPVAKITYSSRDIPDLFRNEVEISEDEHNALIIRVDYVLTSSIANLYAVGII